MFAAGLKEVSFEKGATSGQKRHLDFVSSAFSDRQLESKLLKALPDAEDAPSVSLPMGWEQRCDEKSQRIFFVDHITCTTTWDDPRLRKKEEEETAEAKDAAGVSEDKSGGDDHFDGAAADLAALSLGVMLPTRDEQLNQWARAVERNAHAALLKETGHLRSAADVTQCPRFMLLQQLHRAVVHRLLAEPSRLHTVEHLWRHRQEVLHAAGQVEALPREAHNTLLQHTSKGLTNTYTNHAFGQKKLHLRKVRKVLLTLARPPEHRLPIAAPALPEGLEAQLYRLLLNPPGAEQSDNGGGTDIDVWAQAADAVICLSMATGSLLTLMQLPRAIYCRGAKLPNVPLAQRLHLLQRRCDSKRPCACWAGFGYWVSQAGIARWSGPPSEGTMMAAEDAAVVALVGIATFASNVWNTLAEREGISLLGKDATAPDGGLRLRHIGTIVGNMIALAHSRGNNSASARPASQQLTPQHVTEMWQPLGVELKRDTLMCVVSLCISLLTGQRGKREIVSAICALRILTVHLQLFDRCGVDVGAMLPAGSPPAGSNSASAEGMRAQLLDRLFSVLLLPVSRVDPALQPLWGSMQAEAICTIIGGMSAFFPGVHQRAALLFASLAKERQAASNNAASPFFSAYIAALCQWLGAQKDVSQLIAETSSSRNEPTAAEALQSSIPKALSPSAVELSEMQQKLWKWVLDEAERDVTRHLSATSADSLVASDSIRLLASASQEIVARASLCNVQHQPENVALLSLAEAALTRATRLLDEMPLPESPRALSSLQSRLKPTFIGTLLPWLADSLSLYSAFAFDYSQRLLPLVLALLGTLKRLLDVDASAWRREPASARAQTAPAVPMSTAHPYKPPGPPPGQKKKKEVPKSNLRREEKHEWPGASQLTLTFDRRCCTEEGDWLTLIFYKERQEVPVRTVRVGGQWTNWPKTLVVAADAVHTVFNHSAESQTTEHGNSTEAWGYAFSVVASKRWMAERLDNVPSLVQLRTSLFYLGAKCACLLCSAEPVEKEEKENKHWLHSPLLSRGLPLQLPANHALMHPFFGIRKQLPGDAQQALADDAAFLNDLAEANDGAAASLHRYVLATTPELKPMLDQPLSPVAKAARSLLASLLSYNGLVADARRASMAIDANSKVVAHSLPANVLQPRSLPPSPPASPPLGASPPPSPPGERTEYVSAELADVSDPQSPGGSPPRGPPKPLTAEEQRAYLQQRASSASVGSPPAGLQQRVSSGGGSRRASGASNQSDSLRGELSELERSMQSASVGVRERAESFRTMAQAGAPSNGTPQQERAVEYGNAYDASLPSQVEAALTAREEAAEAQAMLDAAEIDITDTDQTIAAQESGAPPPASPIAAARLSFGEKLAQGFSKQVSDLGSAIANLGSPRGGEEGLGSGSRRSSTGDAPSPAFVKDHYVPYVQQGGRWVEGEGGAAGINWTSLRQQWLKSYETFKEMHEAYLRTLSEDKRAEDQGEGLLKLTRFILLVAQQHVASTKEDPSSSIGEDQLGASISTDMRKLFANLHHSTSASSKVGSSGALNSPRGGTDEKGNARRVEQEVIDIVASRVSTSQLRTMIILQQKRAYSRAAGYHAACELLRVSEGSPRLQCKMLSELVAILKPPRSELSAHYSRDLQCAGPHAFGRLRLAFVGLLEQLVRSLDAEVSPPSGSGEVTIQIHQVWAMRCLLHTEMREEDLPIQHEIGMLPAVHRVMCKLHGLDEVLEEQAPTPARQVSIPSSPASAPRTPEAGGGNWGKTDSVDSKLLPRTVQLLHHSLVSRFLITANKGMDGEKKKGGPAPLRKGGSQINVIRKPPAMLQRAGGGGSNGGSGRSLLDGGASGSHGGSSKSLLDPADAEERIITQLLRDVSAVALRMREILDDGRATLLGADTISAQWTSFERFLYGSLAHLFQLVTSRPEHASKVSLDNGLRILFSLLHIASLRCGRLVLRLLRQLLPSRTLTDLPATLFQPPLYPDGGGTDASLQRLLNDASASNPSPLITFLLALVADQFVEDVPNMPPVLLCCRSLWRGSQVRCALAAEAVVLLRNLALSSGFEEPLKDALRQALMSLPKVADSLRADPAGGQLADSGQLWLSAKLSLGALCVLGGSLPSLFVGCRVGVEAAAEDGEAVAAAERQVGVLVRWDGADDSAAHVLLDSQLSELQMTTTSALQLLPLDDAELPLGTFLLTADMMPAFAAFMPKSLPKVALPSALQHSLVFGLLQTRALKALQGLLKHPSSMRVVLAGGLLPGIMASAATPIPLLGIHHTEILQMRLTLLEQIHIEASTAARLAKEHVVASNKRPQRGSTLTSPRGSARASQTPPSITQQPSGAGTVAVANEPVSAEERSRVAALSDRVDMLVAMGFELTLCQKAVGMFGDDMNNAVVWLTDDQAQMETRQLRRSPSWQRAEELAQAMGGEYSVGVCKKAIERTANPNAAFEYLLTHAAELQREEELEEPSDAAPQVTEVVAQPSDASSMRDNEDEEGGDNDASTIRTVSFRPGSQLDRQQSHLVMAQRRTENEGAPGRRTDLERSDTGNSSFEAASSFEANPLDEFMSAAPLPPPPLPDESTLDVASREPAALLFSRRQDAKDAEPLKPLVAEECLVGRLLRPTPLPANRNCVVTFLNEEEACVQLTSRIPETDSLVRSVRPLTHCQRAEASLASQFPELRKLGANSSGLDAVSGAAHTALAIMLMRQAVIYLLADMQGLQTSHEDSDSAFDLAQLGQPRDLLDLLKLAYHSSGGGNTGGGSPFATLWSLIDTLMRADSEGSEVSLPAPFKALPRLLRDDALAHLRRELKASATLHSSHPLATTKLAGTFPLKLAGASQITLHLDARSQLAGTAQLLFCEDEKGEKVVARWSGAASGWKNLTLFGDTLYVVLSGEVPKDDVKKKRLWGFSVRITASGWVPPEVEMHALEAPLAIGWQLLELLAKHRPIELLTTSTYLAIVRYVHTADAPHRALAAGLLLRLLTLPKSALPSEMANDPRDAWPMDSLLSLSRHVEWHRSNGVDPISGLLPPHVQLCAELVAHAMTRSGNTGSNLAIDASTADWASVILELSQGAQYFLRPTTTVEMSVPPGEEVKMPPEQWVRMLHEKGLVIFGGATVEEMLGPKWPLSCYREIVKLAIESAKDNKLVPMALQPEQLRFNEGLARGALAGLTANVVRARFLLIKLFNVVLEKQMSLVFTGYADRAHTLGAQLCALREIILPEVKQAAWHRMLDATAPIRDKPWIKENPPPGVVVNRHRAAKERDDRRSRMKHTIFSQLHAQLQYVDVAQLKRRDRAFKVRFAGEGADDYGGPYREAFTMMCGELQDVKALPLLLLTPNGQHNLGSNRDKHVMDPAATTPELLKWYEFLGQLTAIALLQKETILSLSLCSVIWKQLVQQANDASDLAGFDEMVCQSLQKIEHIEDEGVDEDLFADLIFESFTAQLSNGQEVEVCEGGSAIDVTWHNRRRYCELVMRTRLKEGRAQTHAMLRGISTMLPVRLLPLFTHGEIERMVCGAPDIDIDILKRHTRFGVSVNPGDPHIGFLWQVLESFTPEQRSKFLVFIWSRNRLPQTEEEWGEQCMKLHTLEANPPDGHFPVSHTCFFSMEWPRYTSFEIARTKLLYAIEVTDMDMDQTAEGRANAGMVMIDE